MGGKVIMKKIIAAVLSVLFCMFSAITVNAYDTAAAPTLTVSNIDSTANRLSWSRIDGASSYIIYLLNENTNKYEKYGGEMKNTSCRDKNLLPNTKYTYKVRAKFPDGSMGKMSNSVSVYTRNKYGNSFYNALQSKSNMPNIYAAVQGEWIYFSVCQTDSPFNDHSEYGALYRMKTDGTNFQLIKDKCFASYINAAGGRLYYIDAVKDNGRVYTIKSCGLDGGNTKIIVKDKELDNYEDWTSYAIEDLEIIDDQMLFNVSALEGRYDGNNIYALDLNSGAKPVHFAGYGNMTADDFSEDFTEEDETAEIKAAAEKEAQRVMSEGLFTDNILRSAYNSPHLKEVPAVEKLLEPQEKWLCAYNGKLYLCSKNGNKVVDNNYNDSGSALMYEDTVYYVRYDKAKGMNYLMKYENGRKTKLYSKKSAGYKLFCADGGKIFFIEKAYDSAAEMMSLGIYSANADGSNMKLLWECEYERYKR